MATAQNKLLTVAMDEELRELICDMSVADDANTTLGTVKGHSGEAKVRRASGVEKLAEVIKHVTKEEKWSSIQTIADEKGLLLGKQRLPSVLRVEEGKWPTYDEISLAIPLSAATIFVNDQKEGKKLQPGEKGVIMPNSEYYLEPRQTWFIFFGIHAKEQNPAA